MAGPPGRYPVRWPPSLGGSVRTIRGYGGGQVYRTAKLVPWYHRVKPECEAVTQRLKEQCINSASYVVTSGPARGMHLCKTHADMEDADTGRPLSIKPLSAETILVRP